MATTCQERAAAALTPPRAGAVEWLLALRQWRAPFLSLTLAVLAWEIVGRVADVVFLPPFSTVVGATWRMIQSGEIMANLAASLLALAIGYALAVGVGIPVGLLLATNKFLGAMFEPWLHALLAVPSLLYVPLLFGIFGVSRLTQIAVIFLYTFVLVASMALSSIRTVDAQAVEMARAFGARQDQLWRSVILPNVLPTLMAGLELGMGRAVRGMVNGEMLIVLVGLGALVRQYGSRFDAASVYGILLVIVAAALVLDFFLRALDRRINHWLEE